ncbi:MAG TPA: hypothetical protein VM582_00335 [Candidatus Thermoplasmatota archaeon]|nr:hypothetical protein [Candidatus Thermoplasmatota archaeon]
MIRAYDPDGTAGRMTAFIMNAGSGATVHHEAVGPVDATVGWRQTEERVDLVLREPTAGARYFLAVAWGDVPWWQVRAQNATLVAGGEARYVRGVDLEGGTYADASLGRASAKTSPNGHTSLNLGTSVHYASGRSLTFEVEHTLIGFFGPPRCVFMLLHCTDHGNYTLTGPAGTAECYCIPKHFSGPAAHHAGTYFFTDDTVGATQPSLPPAVWVDVPFPFPTA